MSGAARPLERASPSICLRGKSTKAASFNYNLDQTLHFNAVFLSDGDIRERSVDWKILLFLRRGAYDYIFVTNYGYATEAAAILALKARGIAVVGIAYKDEPVATRAFLDELGDPFAMVLVDREGRAGLDLGISGVPETFAVDAMGRITAKQSGPLLNDADIERLVASMQAPGRSPPSKNSR